MRGRKGDRTYKGPNGSREQALWDMQKLAKTPAGSAERLAAYSPEAMRQFIESQTCPWCGTGPWKVLAAHTNRAHGVDRFELRKLAGLTKTAPVCDPDHSRQAAERRQGRRLPDVAYERLKGKKRQYSEAGRAVQRAKLAATRTPEQQAAATAASVAARFERDAAKHAEIVRLFGDNLSVKAIAEHVGVTPGMVSRTLKRHGVSDDLVKRRWQVLTPEEREARQRRMVDAALDHAQRKATELVAEFSTLGGSYDAVRRMAREREIAPRKMAERLRRAGAVVPDGRRAKRAES